MQKEILTLSRIQADLRLQIKKGYCWLAFVSMMFLLLLGLFISEFWIDVLAFSSLWLVGIYAEMFLLYFIIRQIEKSAMLRAAMKNGNCIVTDKLLRAEYIDRHDRKLRFERYRLQFFQHGSYVVPTENYPWSPIYAMDDEGVFCCASSGDEFYLVLSAPHAGKILLAYNRKLFELAERI